MKKLILTMLIAFSLISCSKSDDGPSVNKIVGKWVIITSTIQNGSTGNPENNLDNCEINRVYTYTQNSDGKTGVYQFLDSYEDPNTLNCMYIGNKTVNWTDLGSNTYSIGTPATLNTITFTNQDNTMNVVINDGPYILKDTYSRQ